MLVIRAAKPRYPFGPEGKERGDLTLTRTLDDRRKRDPSPSARAGVATPARVTNHDPNGRGCHKTSVKTTESGGPRGYDAGKKTKGRKRHILTDTEGNLVHAVVHTADIQDRDGAPLVLAGVITRFPWLRHVFADGGYAGEKLRDALKPMGAWSIEIIKRSDTAKGFELLPRRWVVERTIAWLNRNRRLAKDFEQTIASATAWLFIASIQLFIRRAARHSNLTA